jgi:hypothetical protein
MMLLGVLAMAYAAIVLFPETPAGRYLRSLLVEPAVAWLMKLSAAKIIVHLGMLAVFAAIVFVVRNSELVILLGQAIPEVLAWLVAIDGITFLELTVTIWLVTSNARVRAAMRTARLAAWRWSIRCASWVATRLRVARERAERVSPRKPQILSSDDDEHPPGAYVFA